MPYTPPNYDEVDFAFAEPSYVAPVYDAVVFAFDPVKFLWCGARWKTKAVVAGELPLDGNWETLGLVGQILRQNATWETSAVTAGELPLDGRWITSSVGGELVVSARWATAIPIVQELPSDQAFAVEPVRVFELPLDALWDTDGAPVNVLLTDGRWATVAPTRDALPADAFWQTFAPTLSFQLVDGRWAIHAPQISELPVDALWRFNVAVARALTILYGSQIANSLTIRYQLGRARVANDLVIPLPMLTRVARGCAMVYDIATVDEIRAALTIRYSLLDGSVIDGTPVPVVTVRGKTFKAQDAEVSFDENDFAWVAKLGLRDPALLALFGPDEPFTVTLGGETYSFIRDEPRFARRGQVLFDVSVSGVSPQARHSDPRATRITKTWTESTLASAVLDEIIDEPITLDGVLDWAIPANRLSAENRTPIEIAKQIAGAAGAVLECDPDGSLAIRPLFPVPVPEWASVEPDHTYDDLRDEFSVSEETPLRRLANAVRVLDGAADDAAGVLQIEVDADEDGLNGGRTEFILGDRPGLLIFRSADVALDRVRASAGSVVDEAAGTREITEDLSFANTDEARLKYPTAALDSFDWLGTDLGTPTLEGETLVRLDAAGVGILRVVYTTSYLARRVANVPSNVSPDDEFSVLVVAEGSR